jgi:hypothetical protein
MSFQGKKFPGDEITEKDIVYWDTILHGTNYFYSKRHNLTGITRLGMNIW